MWSSDGITFAYNSIVGSQPSNIFIDVTDAIYVSSQTLFSVRMWSAEDDIPKRDLIDSINNASSVFVTGNGDIYASSGIDGQIIKWELNATNSTLILIASSICYSIFIDINNTLYCSIESQHQIMKYFFDGNTHNNTVVIAGGNGLPGSGSDMLNSPKGLFVSVTFNLYVADCSNDRIQLFENGTLNAITVAGNGAPSTFVLSCPTAVILDADAYLFIADGNNHRIIGEGPNGFQCIIGCSGIAGSAPYQLNYPQNLAFDSSRNLFVVDKNNDRVQKFNFIADSCSKY
jgi:DNA-binding beta-propeller fold protein YncE